MMMMALGDDSQAKADGAISVVTWQGKASDREA